MARAYKPYYDKFRYLEKHVDAFMRDYSTLCKEHGDAKTWHEKDIHNGKWSTFILIDPITHKPKKKFASLAGDTIRAISDVQLPMTAGFSILAPGAIITPHRGYTSDVVRVHVALKVPQGDIGMRVGRNKLKWEEGKILVFDDTVEHEVWNRTDETRLVLLLDYAW